MHAVIDPSAPTGLMIKERRTADATRVWYYRAGSAGSHLSAADLPPGVIESAALLHITGITPALSESAAGAITTAIDRASGAGVPVSFGDHRRFGHQCAVTNLDSTRTVGLVTLPGAFVGVLLSTGSATQAGAVQILILIAFAVADLRRRGHRRDSSPAASLRADHRIR